MEWLNLVPESVATEQVAYERARSVNRMIAIGLSTKAIGEKIGISAKRVWQLDQKYRRWLEENSSPVEKYLKKPPFGNADVMRVLGSHHNSDRKMTKLFLAASSNWIIEKANHG